MAGATKVIASLATCACILAAGSATAAGPGPVVSTGGAKAVTATSATLAGTVNPNGQETSYDFEYGTSTAYGSTAPSSPIDAGAGTTNVSVSVPVSSLAPNTTYHYRLVATSPSGVTDGFDQTFTTKTVAVVSAPVVGTGGVSAVTATSATLAGTVYPNGQETSYDFEYGTSTAYGRNAPSGPADAGAGTTNVSVSAPVVSLAPSTTYHYRLVATNPSGTAHGADHSFRTPAVPKAPVVATGGVEAVTATSATLTGTVDPKGEASSYYFEYGTGRVLGGSAPSPPAGAAPGETSVHVSVAVASLAPNTTYHYRLVATSAAGTTRGSEHTFKTGEPASGVTIFASPNPIVFGQVATVDGSVRGHGAADASVSLQVSSRGAGPYVTVAARRAGRHGAYSFTGQARSSSTYFRVLANGAISAPLFVPVRFHITFFISNTHPVLGQRVRFHGRVAPRSDGMRVLIQRRGSGGRWLTIARPRLHRTSGDSSLYSILLRAGRAGLYRVIAGPHSEHARGFSRNVRIRLR